jgi:hypothetical protein
VSDNNSPDIIELIWDKPRTFNAARIITGQSGGNQPKTPITSFTLQYFAKNKWQDIPGASVVDNTLIDWGGRFDRITTSRLRLVVYDTPGSLTRIWEFEIYNLPD